MGAFEIIFGPTFRPTSFPLNCRRRELSALDAALKKTLNQQDFGASDASNQEATPEATGRNSEGLVNTARCSEVNEPA
jgi:hypothetical protein